LIFGIVFVLDSPLPYGNITGGCLASHRSWIF